MPLPKKEYYYSIDAAKFICALLVVAVHCMPFGYSEAFLIPNQIVRNYIARIAVPFFFVSSGYFYFKSNYCYDYKKDKERKFLSRFLFLYIFWCLVYFPMHIPGILNDPKGAAVGALKYLRDFVFIGGHIHLWYLSATVFAILVISALLEKNLSIERIFRYSLVLYFIGLLGQGYSFLLEPLKRYSIIKGFIDFYENVFVTTRNGLFEAFTFVSMGLILADHRDHLPKRTSLICLILSMAGFAGELLLVKHFSGRIENDYYISLLPAIFFFYRYISKIKLEPSDKYKTLRKSSTLIYFTHPWVKNVLGSVLKRVNSTLPDTCLLFILTVICCILLSMAVIKLSEIKGFKWLKKIY